MKLTQLFEHLPYQGSFPESAGVSDLAYDSRKAGPDTAFICLVGANVDGHR
ncbi:MAG: UDP-N-acetylmuramoyl-L-alanyl-D-glutamate--2,6-diaminopimelate ligase, partial [Clostridiales bacterium]|nr:UDP-N-acetylmuramoyl-L-alanyl-D-glutamate--2,6-diaminopimelate ligase [Clostridiales bacterium]